MIFDTHAHILSGDLTAYPHSALRGGERPPVPAVVFPVEELLAAMDREGVARACVVQRATLYGYDNSYMLAAAAAHGERLSPVAVLDAQEPASSTQLDRLVGEHGLAGLRIVAPRLTEHDTDWLASPQALELWTAAERHRLPMAVILYRRNNAAGLIALEQVARRFTGLPIVLDHCGLPHPSTPEMRFAASEGIHYTIEPPSGFGIEEAIGRFADLPHVHIKVTDINFDRIEEAGHDSALFVRQLVDRFGPQRIVWGSDVGQSPAPYAEKLGRLKCAASRLTEQERDAFLGGNAVRLYRAAAQ
jgi:predicted TIM-barrel fold metal-dependent hydrolase